MNAQLPACTTGSNGPIYTLSQTGGTINQYDPLTNTTTSLSLTVPGNGLGITLINNTYTWVTVSGNIYVYYDPVTSQWINTGQGTGTTAAQNLSGGCSGEVYNLVGASGEIWKWTGNGTGSLLTTVSDFSLGGPYDLTSDQNNNFYILRARTNGSGQWLRQYNSAGVMLYTWNLIGMPNVNAGGGFAIVGNTVYVTNGLGFHTGVLSGSTINFTTQNPAPLGMNPVNDYASCPNSAPFGQGISTLSAPCAPLPLQLIKFDVKIEGVDKAHLQWETIEESNFSHFELEKSFDGKNFEYLETIVSKNNGLEPGNETRYETSDYGLLRVITYYRLKMVDLDGQFQYSWIEELKINSNRDRLVTISPSPASSLISLGLSTLNNDHIQIKLYNVNGQLVKEREVITTQGFSSININIEDLVSGMYILNAYIEGESIAREKVMIAK